MPSRVAHDDERGVRLPAGRKADLAAYVADVGEVTVTALADRFGVSADTIRRDLDQLDSEGLLIRTHGGAVSATALPRPDTGLDVREKLQIEAKARIGSIAAGLIDDGASVMMNGGTTMLALVRHLRNHRRLTIATNNLRIPIEISPETFNDLYLFGGPVRMVTQTTTGPVRFHVSANGSEHPVRCDLTFIAVGGLSVEDGYSTSSLEDAAMMRDMMERGRRVVILADSTKFGRRLFAQIAELGRADCLVTDQEPPPDLLAALHDGNVEILTPSQT